MDWANEQRETLLEAARRMLEAAEASDGDRRRLRGGIEWLLFEAERGGGRDVSALWNRLRSLAEG